MPKLTTTASTAVHVADLSVIEAAEQTERTAYDVANTET